MAHHGCKDPIFVDLKKYGLARHWGNLVGHLVLLCVNVCLLSFRRVNGMPDLGERVSMDADI